MIRLILLCSLCVLSTVHALNNGLALTPPMGWNPWNRFMCNTSSITETLFQEMAKAMVTSGMAAAGYEYINLDDCWFATTRNSSGHLQPDPERFPSGIKALADYVHSVGLKFGIYEDTGNITCRGNVGSYGYYKLDAETYASWDVDYVKLDGCFTEVSEMKDIYTQNSIYLNQTGRPMIYSCSWPTYANLQGISMDYNYIGTICNLWREWADMNDSFDQWTMILDYQIETNLNQFSGPGKWNDPDMLEVGNGGQTEDEYRAMFSIWAILAAPLIAGNDLRNMTEETLAILTAPEVIAVDQDPLGIQGSRVYQSGDLEVYTRPLVDGSQAVVLFNRSPDTANIQVTWADLGLQAGAAQVRDLWAQQDLGSFDDVFSANVRSHAVVMVKITQ